MKIAIIVPYFGKLPSYFQIFLDSCSYNTKFDWLIFSDDVTPYNYPENVQLVKMTFDECRKRIQSKFDFSITLHTTQKLCDYKCGYGYIFSDYLKEYAWWGHCDLDQVFGNLGAFITDEMLSTYDKIGSIGHLTLYRNTPENNTVFMRTERYREVFTTERGCGFDEWLPGNVNEIYRESDHLADLKNRGADLHPYRMTFQTVDYDVEKGVYLQSTVLNAVFLFDKGDLMQIYEEDGKLKHVAYPYVHLQKRTMTDHRDGKSLDRFYIVPNSFADADIAPEKLLKKAKLRGIVNTQYIKVKWKSLKYRLHSGDWKFSSVFRK